MVVTAMRPPASPARPATVKAAFSPDAVAALMISRRAPVWPGGAAASRRRAWPRHQQRREHQRIDVNHPLQGGEQRREHQRVDVNHPLQGGERGGQAGGRPGSEALYEFASNRVGALRGVRQLEIWPELRRLKQAGSLLDGPRLANPAA